MVKDPEKSFQTQPTTSGDFNPIFAHWISKFVPAFKTLKNPSTLDLNSQFTYDYGV